jgi:hypothetical protein
MLEFYLQTLADLAQLPDDAPQDMRELMEGALFLTQFSPRESSDLDESQCIGKGQELQKMAEEIRSGRCASRRVQ